LSDFDLGMMCRAIGLEHLQLTRDGEARAVLQEASKIHLNKRPVVVEALMDSTYRTFFTRGVVRTNFGRLPWGERLRFVARVLERRLPGVG
jgi:hypothetical protein